MTTDKTEEESGTAEQDWRWADPKSLKVNPAFHAIIPLQSRGELLALEQSIEAEGCRDPSTPGRARTSSWTATPAASCASSTRSG
jgi:hypothetical protein